MRTGLSNPYFTYKASNVSSGMAFPPENGLPGNNCINENVMAIKTNIVIKEYITLFNMYFI